MASSLRSETHIRLISVLISERQSKKLTQQTVASRMGKPQSYVAKIEGGERRLDVAEFVELAQALDSDALDLLNRVVAR